MLPSCFVVVSSFSRLHHQKAWPFWIPREQVVLFAPPRSLVQQAWGSQHGCCWETCSFLLVVVEWLKSKSTSLQICMGDKKRKEQTTRETTKNTHTHTRTFAPQTQRPPSLSGPGAPFFSRGFGNPRHRGRRARAAGHSSTAPRALRGDVEGISWVCARLPKAFTQLFKADLLTYWFPLLVYF